MEKLQQQYEELKGALSQKIILLQKEMKDNAMTILSKIKYNDTASEKIITEKKNLQLHSEMKTVN